MSFYVGASKSFGQKLTMEASLMEEYYHTPIWDEWNLFPTLSITYLPKAGHIINSTWIATETTLPIGR